MSSKALAGKVAIVTGGSKGIGRAVSIKLASEGAKVVVNYSGDEKAAEQTAKEAGSNAVTLKADVSSVQAISKLVDETVKKFGKIDIVVACAGVMSLSDIEKITEEEFDKVFNLNVKGPLFLAQKAAPHMGKGSRIVLFSTSQCALTTVTPNYTTYIASKGAIEQMVRGLSKGLAPKGIMVNCVSPGPTATDLFLKGKSQQMLDTIAGFNPQKRIGQPEEIAEAVAFFCSPGCGWVTGQTLKVNGGAA